MYIEELFFVSDTQRDYTTCGAYAFPRVELFDTVVLYVRVPSVLPGRRLSSSIYFFTLAKKVITIYSKTDEILKQEFYNLATREDVAKILEIDEKSLRYFLYVVKPDNMYTTFKIAKKSGGMREINSPSKELKAIQRKLAHVLSLVYKVKPSAFGFVQKRNIKDNASKHTRKKVILNIDLKDFFSQIHFGRVRGMLMSKPYGIGQEAATVIAQIACYNRALPQGAPTSPVLTNMICGPLDTHLTNLAKKFELVYTRYADDITFSTFNPEFPAGIIEGEVNSLIVGRELDAILKKNSFSVNPDKVFLNNNKARQEVTGLIVNRFPNIKREYLKSIRAILHNCFKEGTYETARKYVARGLCKNKNIIENINNTEYMDKIILWFKAVLKGKINFIKEIRGFEDYTFLKYAEQLNRLFGETIFNVEKHNEFFSKIVYNVVVLENEDSLVQGSGFFLKNIGLVTGYHVTEDNGFFKVSTYKRENVGIVSKEINEIKCDKEIDYAIYDLKNSKMEGLELGDSSCIEVGDKVTVIGYPDYLEGDTPYVHTCRITSRTRYLGECLYTVSTRIIHGASGGAVLNENNEVIGIIKAGVVSFNEKEDLGKHGFIPIHIALNHCMSE